MRSRQTEALRKYGLYAPGAAVRLAPVPLVARDPDLEKFTFPKGFDSHRRSILSFNEDGSISNFSIGFDQIGHIKSVTLAPEPADAFSSYTIEVQWLPNGQTTEHFPYELELLPKDGV